ncbi:Hypp7937 [Branchiostoma lanceolatum]|uniref:Hypp7937 protein n=2 Tax=Branchiostoma lanceolatum TaxID=7740 RepID=A0A8K0EE43_BRALA|nr:Hypp7937 [Branchiostoma lanceolatum]
MAAFGSLGGMSFVAAFGLFYFLSQFHKDVATVVQPKWPKNYKTCVMMETSREFITAGWYVDDDVRATRLDSYGIPFRDDHLYSSNDIKTVLEGITFQLASTNHRLPRSGIDYACAQLGPPLYTFIMRYKEETMYSLYPSPEGGVTCKQSRLVGMFPQKPLVPNIQFIGNDVISGVRVGHFRSEFFLFALDYYFNNATGLPRALLVNAANNTFLTFEDAQVSKEVFQPPPGVTCHGP